MGMTPRQLLLHGGAAARAARRSSPASGSRRSIGVGTATIAAAIGAGGLGEYIFRGLSMVDTTTILAGAIPAAAARARGRRPARLGSSAASAAPVARAAASCAWPPRPRSPGRRRARLAVRVGAIGGAVVTVGSKNFTEQIILGETHRAGARSARACASTGSSTSAARSSAIARVRSGRPRRLRRVHRHGRDRRVSRGGPARSGRGASSARGELYAAAGLTAGERRSGSTTPSRFSCARPTRARSGCGRSKICAVSPARWTPGFGYEFLQRADGYPGLVQDVWPDVRQPPRAMDLSLIYKALADGQVDVIAGDATSALIDALDLATLDGHAAATSRRTTPCRSCERPRCCSIERSRRRSRGWRAPSRSGTCAP